MLSSLRSITEENMEKILITARNSKPND
jgi:hypothetical protein